MLTASLWLVLLAAVSVLFNPYAQMAVSAHGGKAILEFTWALARQLPWPLVGAALLLALVFVLLRALKRQTLGAYVFAYSIVLPLMLAPAIVFMSDSMGPEKSWALLVNYLALVLFMLPIPLIFWWIAEPKRLSSNPALQPTHASVRG